MAPDGKGPSTGDGFLGRHKKRWTSGWVIVSGSPWRSAPGKWDYTAARSQHIAETHGSATNPLGALSNNQFTDLLVTP